MADKLSVADEAINTALAAESAATDAIRRCEEEAQRLVGEARAAAYRLTERTDHRISSLHASCQMKVRQQTDELLKHGGETEIRESIARTGGAGRLLQRAAEGLASQLTTPERRDKGPQSS